MGVFQKARVSNARLRLALCGPAGHGKTYTSLAIATGLGGPIGVIDTERRSSEKYARDFDFSVLEMGNFDPKFYIDNIGIAQQEGIKVLVIDSLSHAWTGKGGALEKVDNATKRGGNSFTAWKDVTPLHNQLVDAILQFDGHVIVTMRSKVEYIIETNSQGKSVPKKVGMAPIQREGMDYEFDIVADLRENNDLVVGKTRYSAIAGAVIPKAGVAFGEELRRWLTDGPMPSSSQSFVAPARPAPVGSTASPAASSSPAATPVVDPVDRSPRPTPQGLATPELVQEFDRLAGVLGVTPQARRDLLGRHGVAVPSSLPIDDIMAEIRQMTAKLEAKTGVEQMARTIEGATPEAARAEVYAAIEPTNGVQTPQDPVDEFYDYIARLGMTDGDIQAILGRRGVARVDELPAGELATINGKLRDRANAEVANATDQAVADHLAAQPANPVLFPGTAPVLTGPPAGQPAGFLGDDPADVVGSGDDPENFVIEGSTRPVEKPRRKREQQTA